MRPFSHLFPDTAVPDRGNWGDIHCCSIFLSGAVDPPDQYLIQGTVILKVAPSGFKD
jgi:hypothetical protein